MLGKTPRQVEVGQLWSYTTFFGQLTFLIVVKIQFVADYGSSHSELMKITVLSSPKGRVFKFSVQSDSNEPEQAFVNVSVAYDFLASTCS